MLTDAHCHPSDLVKVFPGAEYERRKLNVMCAASATGLSEFEYCERLSRQAETETAAPLLPCFAVHPQLPAIEANWQDSLATLETLAAGGRLSAIGETGFDLFNDTFKSTEKIQDGLFVAHLEAALRHGLPLILHVRRAMHKVFAHSRDLKRCRAVVFHSWSGTLGEGEALLKRGVNAFFSFGTGIMRNHRGVMRCCALLPADRLLTETDAPYQVLRGREFSSYGDLPHVIETAAALRCEAGTAASGVEELERTVEENFCRCYVCPGIY